MIVVTGATGNVGRPLTRALVEAGEPVTAVSRHEAAVPAGVRHVVADLTTLEPVLAGAKALFLMLPGNVPATDVIGQAAAAGVRRVVLMSTLGVVTRPSGPTRIAVRTVEDALRDSGLDWTILRPGGFASNVPWWAESIRTQRLVVAPFGDVGVPTVDPLDIAEVAAVCLRDDRHVGGVYELTGPELITPREQAAAIGAALNEPVRFQELTRAEAHAAMSRIMPPALADDTLDILGTPHEAELRVSPDVSRVLGRPAHPFAAWAARNVAVFR